MLNKSQTIKTTKKKFIYFPCLIKSFDQTIKKYATKIQPVLISNQIQFKLENKKRTFLG